MEHPTIDTVKEAFQEWRKHRRNSAEPIPENLWEMAIGLEPHYKRSTICQQLRLGGSQFKQRLEGARNRLTEGGFVLASRDKVEANSKLLPEVQLTIQGEVRSLRLCVDVSALSQVLPHLGALL